MQVIFHCSNQQSIMGQLSHSSNLYVTNVNRLPCSKISLMHCSHSKRCVDWCVAQVQRMTVDKNDQIVFDSYVNVTLEAHTACDSKCRVTAEDCVSSIHVYNEAACSCDCLNNTMAAYCAENKLWSTQQCGCICPMMTMCFEDEVYDFITCR